MPKNTSNNLDDIESRKGDHIRLCLDPKSQAHESVFDSYRLPYNALPEISLDNVDTSVSLCGKTLQSPLIIGSMTGGSRHGRTINTNLAIATETCQVAMGVGSQRIGLEKSEAQDTFKLVRKHAPTAFIFANMGAVQLNYGHGVDSYRQTVDMIEADALYLHLNPLQEALQPGGDSDFSGLLEKIRKLVDEIGVPVFIKEVGHGISRHTAKQLFEAGVTGVDTAGAGGTSYAWVEAKRAKNNEASEWFKDFGVPTDESIRQVAAEKNNNTQLIIGSGGIRGPVDGLKARALGADFFSAAVPFLRPAMNSADKTVETIENWKQGLRVALFATGTINWEQAKNIKLMAYSHPKTK